MGPDETINIVIDNGSRYMKSGFTGDEVPRSVISTLIGEKYSTQYYG